MPLVIREIHPAPSPQALNEEWLLIENTGPGQINTKGCALGVSSARNPRARSVGTLDPGFVIQPGEKVRLITGSPAKKAQGSPPAEEGVKNYHLFLRERLLGQAGQAVHLMLNQHELCSARFEAAKPAS